MTEETANAVRATNTLRSVGVLWSIAIGALVVFLHIGGLVLLSFLGTLAMSMLGSR